ncbi:RagB/SusD family nutrient uptake outer membrane protein [Muribaculaceae bacterium Isolate-110 (HZI)]|nr:RagB/SusD family nutrient uptake outer membrane protein [Muribaculaceae bacterium Isolate-110 (HZI)]
MKLRNIFIAGMSVVALVGCNDYLEVDAPSKNFPTDVFSDARAMERARNGVYASMLSSNMFGDKLINAFCRNSDVDFVSNSSQYTTTNKYCRFDCDPSGSDLKNSWSDLYHGIEVCNLFIEGAEGSPAYDPENPDGDIVQMIGEAKVARAMFYHELIWLFGDVPFSFNSSQTTTTMVYPVTDRIEILNKCIEDIKSVADGMKDPSSLSEGVERISRQAAYAMIARLAMTAGGWYLAPDGDTYGKMTRAANYLEFYKTAREYAKKVIDSNVHNLSKDYYKVFVDECNNIVTNNDDPIFEIPFGKESTGNIGYIHGPKMELYEGQSPHPYGEAKSSARLNALYRFMFDEDDERRDYVNQLFRYTAEGSEYTCRFENSYTVQNGKWSKLWVTGGLGRSSQGSTGINYPYLRYADVLLMFAEADNEIEGQPTTDAIDAVKEVRKRAFRNTNPIKAEAFACGDYEEFKKTILDERKFEFAGENMRWRDLVRNNMYSVELYWTFFRNLAIAEDAGGSSTYTDLVSEHDFGYSGGYDKLPYKIATLRTYKNLDPITKEAVYSERQFPNNDIMVCWAANPYEKWTSSQIAEAKNKYTKLGSASISTSSWTDEDVFAWWNDDAQEPKDEIRYSLLGFIQYSPTGSINLMRNGNLDHCPDPSENPTVDQLPVVRYILPYPASEIARSHGAYVNKYGYSQQ